MVGLATCRPETKKVTSLLLVSDRGTYTNWWNGRALVRPMRLAVEGK